MNDEEKKEGLEIIEEDVFEPEISDEELEQFYDDNRDAIDLIGGLDMFESLMGLDDESFEQLKPQVLHLFAETLYEPESISEFRTLAIAQVLHRLFQVQTHLLRLFLILLSFLHHS